MGLKISEIFGIGITTDSRENILEEVEKYLSEFRIQYSEFSKKAIKPLVIFTPNPEIIMYAQKNPDFKKTVRSAQINLPDGAGVVWALFKRFRIKISRISGADFVQDLVVTTVKKRYTIGLIGGREGLALKALECLQKKHKNLVGWVENGPEIEIRNSKPEIPACRQAGETNSNDKNSNFQNYVKNITEKIIKEKTSIIFVGMGFPKQEWFINEVSCQLSVVSCQHPVVLMAVGGTFDYLAGRVARAPGWMREKGLEWFYRLLKEPMRLKRQLLGARFFLEVLRGES